MQKVDLKEKVVVLEREVGEKVGVNEGMLKQLEEIDEKNVAEQNSLREKYSLELQETRGRQRQNTSAGIHDPSPVTRSRVHSGGSSDGLPPGAALVKTLEEMRDGDRAPDVRGAAHRSLTDALS